MAVLKNIVAFANLAPAVPTALPHALIDAEGRGLVPDVIFTDNPFVVVLGADAINVTVRNDSGNPANANTLCERFHTTPRAIPPGLVNLPVQPYIPASTGIAGVISPSVVVASYSTAGGPANAVLPASGTANNIRIIRKTSNDGNVLTIVPAGGDTVNGPRALVAQYDAIMLIDDGVGAWNVISSTPALGRTVASGAVHNMTYGENFIASQYSLSGLQTVNLISAAVAGPNYQVVVKDEDGNAGNHPITVDAAGAETIDGELTFDVAKDYNAVVLISDGVSNWSIF